MDTPYRTANDLVRPWRRATLVASVVAALELVLLVGAGAALLAKPLSHTIARHARTAAKPPPPRHVAKKTSKPRAAPPVHKVLPRGRVKIMVLNGNGRAGAAAGEASKLQSLGYVVSGAANARRQDYAATVVMYSPGFRAEGLRLARDLQVKVVGPLDGLRRTALEGGQLAVVLGA